MGTRTTFRSRLPPHHRQTIPFRLPSRRDSCPPSSTRIRAVHPRTRCLYLVTPAHTADSTIAASICSVLEFPSSNVGATTTASFIAELSTINYKFDSYTGGRQIKYVLR